MATIKWELDPNHSELGFKIKHLMISNVSGAFKKFDVQAETDDESFGNAKIKATAEMNSITTNNEQRDHHLQSSDFFEAEKYPQLEFVSSKIEKTGADSFNLFGNLTMKGITKEVKLTVEQGSIMQDPWGKTRTGFSVSGKINRNDWGITFNSIMETGGLGLGEEVKIIAEIQLTKQQAAVSA
jgi:polyisoprenoid-binding protein YceI